MDANVSFNFLKLVLYLVYFQLAIVTPTEHWTISVNRKQVNAVAVLAPTQRNVTNVNLGFGTFQTVNDVIAMVMLTCVNQEQVLA